MWNNNILEIIEVLLFFANFNINPNLFLELRENSEVKLVIVLLKRLKELYLEIKY